MTKTLLEILRDLETLASDMKKDNENYFKNMFYLASDIRDKSQELSGLKPEDEEAVNEELELAHEDEMRQEEGLIHEEE